MSSTDSVTIEDSIHHQQESDSIDNQENDDIEQGLFALDIGLVVPLTALGIFLVGVLVFHCVLNYRQNCRRRPKHSYRVGGKADWPSERPIRRGSRVRSSNLSTRPLTRQSARFDKESRPKSPLEKPLVVESLLRSKVARLVSTSNPIIVHSDPNMRQQSNNNERMKPATLDKLRSSSIGIQSYSDPAIGGNENNTRDRVFGFGLYEHKFRPRAKSLEIFEIDRTITASASGRGTVTSVSYTSTCTCTSLPRLQPSDGDDSRTPSFPSVVPDISVSLGSLQNMGVWINDELQAARDASGIWAPQNSLNESSPNVTSVGPGLDSDFGASAGFSQRVVSSDVSMVSRLPLDSDFGLSAGFSQRIVSSNTSMVTRPGIDSEYDVNMDSNHLVLHNEQIDILSPISCDWDNFGPTYRSANFGYVDEHFFPILAQQQHWV